MQCTARVLVVLGILGLFAMPLQAGCPGRCEGPPGFPGCETYYVLRTGCIEGQNWCAEWTCVFYPDDPTFLTSSVTREDGEQRLDAISCQEVRSEDASQSEGRAAESPVIKVRQAVEIPART